MKDQADRCDIISTYFYKRTTQSVCKICHKSYSFGSTLYYRGHYRKNHPSFFSMIKAGYTYDEAKQRIPSLLKKRLQRSPRQNLKANEICDTIDEQISEAVITHPTLSNKSNQSTELRIWTVEIPAVDNSNKTEVNSLQNENVKVKRTLHNVEFLTYFRTLQQNERYIDVKLCAEGRLIKCHRLVLSSVSEHFENILKDFPVNEVPIIYLNGVPYWVLDTLVQYMYTGEFEVETGKLPELQRVAKDLRVKGFEAAILQSQKTKKNSPAYASSCSTQATNDGFQKNGIGNSSCLTPERSPILKKGFFSVLMPKKVRWKDSVNEDLVQYSNEVDDQNKSNQNSISLDEIAPENINSSNNNSDILPNSPKNRGSPRAVRVLPNKTDQKDLKIVQSLSVDSKILSLPHSDASSPRSPICKRLKFDENDFITDTARLKETNGLSTAKNKWHDSTGALAVDISPKHSKNLRLTPEGSKKDNDETVAHSPRTRQGIRSIATNEIKMPVSNPAAPKKPSPIIVNTLSPDSSTRHSHSSGNKRRNVQLLQMRGRERPRNKKNSLFLADKVKKKVPAKPAQSRAIDVKNLNPSLTKGSITAKKTSRKLRNPISDGSIKSEMKKSKCCVIIESNKSIKVLKSLSNNVNDSSSLINLKKHNGDSPEHNSKKVLRSNSDILWSQRQHLSAASNDVNDSRLLVPLKKHKSDSPEHISKKVLRSSSNGLLSQTQHLRAASNDVNDSRSSILLKKDKSYSLEDTGKKVLRSSSNGLLSQTQHSSAASNDVNDSSSLVPLKKHKSDSLEHISKKVLRSSSNGLLSQTQHLSAASNDVNDSSSLVPLKKHKSDSLEHINKKVLRSSSNGLLSQTQHLSASSNDVNDSNSLIPLMKHKSGSPEHTGKKVLRSNCVGQLLQTHSSAAPSISEEKSTKLQSVSPKKEDLNGLPAVTKSGRPRSVNILMRAPEMVKHVSPKLASLGGFKCRSSSMPNLNATSSSKEDKIELQPENKVKSVDGSSKSKKNVEATAAPKKRGRPRSVDVITEVVRVSNGIKHNTSLLDNFCESNAKIGLKNNTAGDVQTPKKLGTPFGKKADRNETKVRGMEIADLFNRSEVVIPRKKGKPKSIGELSGAFKPNISNGILANSKKVKIVRRFSMSDLIERGKKNDETCIDIETPRKRGRLKSISLFETKSKDAGSNKSSDKKERTNTSSEKKKSFTMLDRVTKISKALENKKYHKKDKAKLSQEKLSDETLSSSGTEVEYSPLHRYLQLRPVTTSLKRNLKALQFDDKKRQSEKASALMLYIKNASKNILKTRRKLAINAWHRHRRNKTNISITKRKNTNFQSKEDPSVFDFVSEPEVQKERKPKSKTPKKGFSGVSKNGNKKTNAHIKAASSLKKRRVKKEEVKKRATRKYSNNIKNQEHYKKIIEYCKKKKLTVRLSQSDLIHHTSFSKKKIDSKQVPQENPELAQVLDVQRPECDPCVPISELLTNQNTVIETDLIVEKRQAFTEIKRVSSSNEDKAENEVNSDVTVDPSQLESNALKIENYEWCSDESMTDDENSWDSFPVPKSIEKDKNSTWEPASVKQENTCNLFTDNQTLNNDIFGTSILENTAEIDDGSYVNSALHSEIIIKEEPTVDPWDMSDAEIKEEHTDSTDDG